LKPHSVPHIYSSALAPTPFMDSAELSRLLLPIRPVDHVHGP